MKPEIIGFFLEGDHIEVANPCRIPIEFMKDAIKQHDVKQKGVSVFSLIQIPFKLRGVK